MHPTIKRYINVAIDGLVQRLRGPGWIMPSVILGIVFISLAVFAPKFVNLKRGTARTLLEIPKGFLDYKLDGELAMLALPAILGKLTAIMNEVARSMDEHTGALKRASSTSQQIERQQGCLIKLGPIFGQGGPRTGDM